RLERHHGHDDPRLRPRRHVHGQADREGRRREHGDDSVHGDDSTEWSPHVYRDPRRDRRPSRDPRRPPDLDAPRRPEEGSGAGPSARERRASDPSSADRRGPVGYGAPAEGTLAKPGRRTERPATTSFPPFPNLATG